MRRKRLVRFPGRSLQIQVHSPLLLNIGCDPKQLSLLESFFLLLTFQVNQSTQFDPFECSGGLIFPQLHHLAAQNRQVEMGSDRLVGFEQAYFVRFL